MYSGTFVFSQVVDHLPIRVFENVFGATVETATSNPFRA